jgi:8-oxo-dGTP pyrophosphatase MutT (NUDIX family)
MTTTNTTIDLRELELKIKNELQKELPGFSFQKRMSPSFREKAIENADISIARESSVLILFYPHQNQLYLPFIKRTSGNIKHSGQISLPGGKSEKTDANRIETAIRETYEELGVKKESIQILGSLTELYIPVSDFMVLPVVGYCTERPNFNSNQFEVEEILEVSVNEFLAENNQKEFSFEAKIGTVVAPYFDAKGHKVWGATAMILSELKEILLRTGLISD